MTGDYIVPGLCRFAWRQGVIGKRHVCNRPNYPTHHHSCCCGVLLTAALADSISAAQARREVDGDREGDSAA